MSGMNPPTENALWYGDWKLTGKSPNRLLTHYKMTTFDTAEPVERIFEEHEIFESTLRDLITVWRPTNFHHSVPGSKHVKPEPAVEKTTTEVTEVHSIRLNTSHSICHGPFDTANDAVLCASLINSGGSLDEGEWYEAITCKTTVETTIL